MKLAIGTVVTVSYISYSSLSAFTSLRHHFLCDILFKNLKWDLSFLTSSVLIFESYQNWIHLSIPDENCQKHNPRVEVLSDSYLKFAYLSKTGFLIFFPSNFCQTKNTIRGSRNQALEFNFGHMLYQASVCVIFVGLKRFLKRFCQLNNL